MTGELETTNLNSGYTEQEVSISEIQKLLDDGYEVQVDSPDGWVDVNFFVDKGMWQEYILNVEGFDPVRCNEAHLFETKAGWKSAKELVDTMVEVLCDDGQYHTGHVSISAEQIPIVDINVNHENHRYYTNGISSHNTGVGKSLAMCSMAAGNLMDQKNVLYISLELSEEMVAQRIDQNLLDVTQDELMDLSRDEFERKVDKVRESTKGKFVVKSFPPASVGSGHFRHLLNELRVKKNFVPNVIYLDYINLCTSARIKAGSNFNSYTYIKAIAEEIRGLAVEFDVPVITATQTNRDAVNSSDIELDNTSDSMGLPMTLDFMLALISTEELDEQNQLMVKQLKNRFGDPSTHKRFLIGVDRSKMRLYDIDSSYQVGVMGSGAEEDVPLMDSTAFGEADNDRSKTFKKNKFKGFS